MSGQNHGQPLRTTGRLAASGALACLLATVASPALAQSGSGSGGMVMNASSDAYRQRAVQGNSRHSFSPVRPPANGRFVYGHWTPYDPPAPDSYPPDATTHVIVKGDTLWDLSARFYQDPLLWPYIWEANPWVTFPHWIYPGDTLLIPSLQVLPAGDLVAAAYPPITDAFRRAGLLNDFYCGMFLVSPNRTFPGEIIDGAVEPAVVGLRTDDVVYINVGARDGVLPGDEFAIVFPEQHFDTSVNEREAHHEQVVHPITKEKLGVVMRMAGRLKVILLGESVSTARITHGCDAVEVGYDIYPFAEIPTPLVRDAKRAEMWVNGVPPNGRGFIVYSADKTVASAGDHQLMTIDLGTDEGVVPGDVFRVYRDFPTDWYDSDVDHLGTLADHVAARDKMKRHRRLDERWVFGKQKPVPDTPPRVIGELVVLYAERGTATTRLLWSDGEVLLGDRVVYEPVDSGLAQAMAFDSDRWEPGVALNRQTPR